MATKVNDPCREKAAEGEPLFTLRAQDKTAAMIVELWAHVNSYIAAELQAGRDPDDAFDEIEERLAVAFDMSMFPSAHTAKILEAYECAAAMAKWPTRKFPD